jgi:hypothetical protein
MRYLYFNRATRLCRGDNGKWWCGQYDESGKKIEHYLQFDGTWGNDSCDFELEAAIWQVLNGTRSSSLGQTAI